MLGWLGLKMASNWNRPGENREPSPEDRERRQGLWWYLLVGAATLLLLETLLSNWLSRAKPARARS